MTDSSGPAEDPQGARLASYRTLIGISRMLLGSATLDELLDESAEVDSLAAKLG